MSRTNDDYERRDTGARYGAGIGVFDRAVRPPDEEVMEREEAAAVPKMTPVEFTLAIVNLFGWAAYPYDAAKVWGVFFALDQEAYIRGRSMAQVARELNLSRASISNAAVEVCKALGLPPSRAMRSKKTTKKNKVARRLFARPVTTHAES